MLCWKFVENPFQKIKTTSISIIYINSKQQYKGYLFVLYKGFLLYKYVCPDKTINKSTIYIPNIL